MTSTATSETGHFHTPLADMTQGGKTPGGLASSLTTPVLPPKAARSPPTPVLALDKTPTTQAPKALL